MPVSPEPTRAEYQAACTLRDILTLRVQRVDGGWHVHGHTRLPYEVYAALYATDGFRNLPEGTRRRYEFKGERGDPSAQLGVYLPGETRFYTVIRTAPDSWTILEYTYSFSD